MAGPLPRYLLSDNASTAADDMLTVAGVRADDLADEFGTPLFVYDEDHIRERCREAVAAFPGGAAYATKAFLCRAMAALANEEGLALDVATGGELHVALAAGVPPERLVMHGNNKSEVELERALDAGVGRLVIDSFDEIVRLEAVMAPRSGPVPVVLLRLTPGVEAHTHEYIATGQDDSKFGFTVSTGLADEAIATAQRSGAMDLVGVHAHIGSQVFVRESFAKATRVIAEFVKDHDMAEFSVGGGLGVPYVDGEEAPSIAEWGAVVAAACAEVGVEATVSAEPGRAIVAAAALTLYRVGTVKELVDVRTYVAVDGGMSDNPRPVLYGSGYETFLPRSLAAERPKLIRLVGKHCESGDVLVPSGWVPDDIEVGDLLATPVTGAYGHSMGSNYNKVLRPGVVFVRDGEVREVVRRERYADLLSCDIF